MDGVAVYGIDVALLVVVEDTVANEGSGANDVLGMLVYGAMRRYNAGHTLFVMM